jgi:hypothetical protein
VNQMNKNDLKYLKVWIVINYFSLLLMILMFWLAQNSLVESGRLVILVLPFISLILSYYFAFTKTKLWKFTHTPVTELDEREIQNLYKAMRKSYVIFSIFTIGILYLISFSGLTQINVVLASGLLYLAHILPASILGWEKKLI